MSRMGANVIIIVGPRSAAGQGIRAEDFEEGSRQTHEPSLLAYNPNIPPACGFKMAAACELLFRPDQKWNSRGRTDFQPGWL